MSIQESIMKIRAELIAFARECEHLENEKVVAAINRLSDAEVVTLYVEGTFDNEWRGAILDTLAVVMG